MAHADVQQPDRLFENSSDSKDLGYLELVAVAALLRKAPGTVRNMVARREIPFVRLGNRTVFLLDSLRDWLKQKEVKPNGSS